MIFNQNLMGNSKKEKEIQKEVILNLSIGDLTLRRTECIGKLSKIF